MLGERIRLQIDDEVEAGRRRLVRGCLEGLADEVDAGRAPSRACGGAA